MRPAFSPFFITGCVEIASSLLLQGKAERFLTLALPVLPGVEGTMMQTQTTSSFPRKRESGAFFSINSYVLRLCDKGSAFARAAMLILIVCILLFPANFASAQKIDPALQEQILSAAENYFVHLKNKNYAAVWNSLSAKSQAKIISDVRKENKKAGVASGDEALASDFAAGGAMAKAYWDGYLFVFNPDIVLKECKWEMGKVKSGEAEIVLQYKKSEKPAVLKLYRENGAWKFGMDESFGARSLSVF